MRTLSLVPSSDAIKTAARRRSSRLIPRYFRTKINSSNLQIDKSHSGQTEADCPLKPKMALPSAWRCEGRDKRNKSEPKGNLQIAKSSVGPGLSPGLRGQVSI